jgi:hypothetical protein
MTHEKNYEQLLKTNHSHQYMKGKNSPSYKNSDFIV